MSSHRNCPVVGFRVDASIDIGAGHVMRCLVLANQLRQHQVESHFLCRQHSRHMAERIKAAGHEVSLFPLKADQPGKAENPSLEKYRSWLGAAAAEDADDTVRFLQDLGASWLIVDHFAIDAEWEIQVKQALDVKIMIIDGMANRKHACDLLLDPSFQLRGEARWTGLIPADCKLFVGPKYALLRPEFDEACRDLPPGDGNVERILIAFGGMDEPDATGKVVGALAGLVADNIALDVIVGPDNPHRQDLLDRYDEVDGINILVDPASVAQLMLSADLALGSGGSMTWERCLLRLPSFLISIAENQIELAKSLHSISAAIYLGCLHEISADAIRIAVCELMQDKTRIIEMQNACGKLMTRDSTAITRYLLQG